MTSDVSFAAIDEAVEQTQPTMERLASELWRLAELSLQEVRSARLLMTTLQDAGFTEMGQKAPPSFKRGMNSPLA
ncbi:MAG TPA: hypothetical protein VFW76_05540 [Ktedonobacterales bacterium]|nr:hypothetical protein [Ktedonobacterales bacterium]